MPSDLHYTPDEVARLRDEATPGPWGFDTGVVDRLVNGEHHTSDGPPLVFAGEYGDDTIATDVRTLDDAALIAAAPSLAADLLTLHAERERMRAVLLALADDLDGIRDGIFRYGDSLPALDKTLDALSVNKSDYEDAIAGYAAYAIRALAGGAS